LIYKTVKGSLARIWEAEGEKHLPDRQERRAGSMDAVQNVPQSSNSMCPVKLVTKSMNALVACQNST